MRSFREQSHAAFRCVLTLAIFIFFTPSAQASNFQLFTCRNLLASADTSWLVRRMEAHRTERLNAGLPPLSRAAQDTLKGLVEQLRDLAVVDWTLEFEMSGIANDQYGFLSEKSALLTEREQIANSLGEKLDVLENATFETIKELLDGFSAAIQDEAVPLLWKRTFFEELYPLLIAQLEMIDQHPTLRRRAIQKETESIRVLRRQFEFSIQKFMFGWLPQEITASLNSRVWIHRLAQIRSDATPLRLVQIRGSLNLVNFWLPFLRINPLELAGTAKEANTNDDVTPWHSALSSAEAQMHKPNLAYKPLELWKDMLRYALHVDELQTPQSIQTRYESIRRMTMGTPDEEHAISAFLISISKFAYKTSDRKLVRYFLSELRALEQPQKLNKWRGALNNPAKLISWIHRQVGKMLPDFMPLELNRALRLQDLHQHKVLVIQQFVAAIETDRGYSRHSFRENHLATLTLAREKLMELNKGSSDSSIESLLRKVDSLMNDIR